MTFSVPLEVVRLMVVNLSTGDDMAFGDEVVLLGLVVNHVEEAIESSGLLQDDPYLLL